MIDRLFYVFHLMTCDSFYETHPPYDGPGDRCSRDEIAAGTATQYSILGMSTTFCGKSIASQISDAILTLSRNAEPFCCWLDIEKVWPPSSTVVSDSHPGSSRGHTNLGSSSRWRKRNDNYPSDSADHNSGRASWVHVSQPRTHVFQPLTLALVLLSTSLLEKLSNLSDGQQYLDSCKVPSCWAKRLDT